VLDRPLHLEALSVASGRRAIVSEDGDSVWLYLTAQHDLGIERDCWLFNTPTAHPSRDHSAYRAWGLPPPAPPELLTPESVRDPSELRDWRFYWSGPGDEVAVVADGQGLGIVSLHHPRGFARLITAASAWANVWNPELFERLVGGAA
jgi:hypothetical protein